MIRFTIAIVFFACLVTTSCYEGKAATEVRKQRFLFEDGISSTQQTQITQGLNLAKHLSDLMYKHQFSAAITEASKALKGFLGALMPVVGFALSFLGGDSPELQAIRQLYTEVQNGFHRIDVQFSHLRAQVGFVVTQVHFTDLEANIVAVQDEFNRLSAVSNTNGYNYEKGEFIKTFDRTYESSGDKLYNGVMYGGLATGGIFQEVADFSNFDRGATQKFMLGTLNLLKTAAALEITYATLNHDPNIQVKKNGWASRFDQLKTKMEAIDAYNAKNYHKAMADDVNDFAALQNSLSNTEFSKQLYNKLTTKYYWRDWLLIVSPVLSSNLFINHACDLNQHDNHHRSIVVASVDKTKHAAPRVSFSGLKLSRHTLHSSHPSGYTCTLGASTAYAGLPDSARNKCDPYVAAGVLCMHNHDIQIHAAHNRYQSYMPHSGTSRAYVFG